MCGPGRVGSVKSNKPELTRCGQTHRSIVIGLLLFSCCKVVKKLDYMRLHAFVYQSLPIPPSVVVLLVMAETLPASKRLVGPTSGSGPSITLFQLYHLNDCATWDFSDEDLCGAYPTRSVNQHYIELIYHLSCRYVGLEITSVLSFPPWDRTHI